MKGQPRKNEQKCHGVDSRSCPKKIPFCLTKRLSDGPIGEQKWQIEIPEQYQIQGAMLEPDKGKFFVLIGPFGDEVEINAILKKV